MDNNYTEEFIKAMIQVQSELKPVVKDQEGQSGNRKFPYADLESIWDVLQPLLVKNNILLIQDVSTDEGVEYLCSTLLHPSGGCHYSKVEIEFSGSEIKVFGGAITYYRRYAIQAIFCIVCTADVDPEKLNRPIHKDSYDNKVAHINTQPPVEEKVCIGPGQLESIKKLFQNIPNEHKNSFINEFQKHGATMFEEIEARHFRSLYEYGASFLQNGGNNNG